MRRVHPGRPIWTALLVVTIAVLVSGCDWVALGYDASRSGTNPSETTIGPGNVGTLQQQWSATIGPGPTDQSAATWSPVVASGTVFAGSKDGVLRAFDKQGVKGCSGAPKVCQPLWTATLGGEPLTPTVVNGTVFVTSGNTLYALDAAGVAGCTGVPKVCLPRWSASPATDSPVVANGAVFVSTGPTIAAFDAAGTTGCAGTPTTCAPLWTSTPAGCQGIATQCRFSAPSVVQGKVYAVWSGNYEFGQAYLQAFDAAGTTGCSGTPKRCAPLWQTFVRANRPVPPPSIANGRVFVVGNFVDSITEGPPGAWLEAHDAATGSLIWDSKLTGHLAYPPVVAGGRLYVPAGRMRVFDATGVQGCAPNGASRRCSGLFDIANLELTATASIANGVLYDGSAPFTIEGITVPAAVRAYSVAGLTATCAQFQACPSIWTSASSVGATSAPVVVDGTVYVASADGKLWSYRRP
jgi:hypothetical protein